jgi:RNA polymerase sigma-70 factor, ECF subfamily
LKSEINITLLYKEQGPFIARTIRRLVGEGSHVDDLLQETFIAAYKKRGHFDPNRAKSSTWLYGIAFNLCRRFERSERRAGLFKRRLVEADGAVENGSFQTPGRLLERAQAIHMVHEVLKKLPFRQREVFVLYALEGMSGREIAELLNVKEGTVWTRIHQAKNKFSKLAGKRIRSNG